jgi:Aldo/keto reductase family
MPWENIKLNTGEPLIMMHVVCLVSYVGAACCAQGARFPALDLGRGRRAMASRPQTRSSRHSDLDSTTLVRHFPSHKSSYAHVPNSDTAQSYRNETEAGQALRESGVPRSQVFITTKFSGMKDVDTSIYDSLKNVRLFK